MTVGRQNWRFSAIKPPYLQNGARYEFDVCRPVKFHAFNVRFLSFTCTSLVMSCIHSMHCATHCSKINALNTVWSLLGQ